ncbi:MAG: aspartate kinase [Candidatus Pacebacteria bacterium]|nr:aspartate kinase [Candidatus Paceibacterota bacterium]
MKTRKKDSSPKKIIVNKFGGGILIKDFIPLMVERLQEQIKDGFSPVVVISAFPGVTDELLKISDKTFLKQFKEKNLQKMIEMGFSKEWIKKTQIELNKIFTDLEKDLKLARTVLANEDKIVAYGEKLSATIFTFYLEMLGLPAQRFLAEEIPIITDDNFKNANIIYEISQKNLQKKIQNKTNTLKEIPVIPGFTGRTKKGKTTTLGRGGTDTTACFVGSALRAEKVILWKDVGGVFSADPKIVPEAKTLPVISYKEAEMAGKIIHGKAIQYVKLSNTPLEITFIANPKLKTKVSKSL